MSNRAVLLQKIVPNNPEAGLALVTKPVPKAEPGQVVVRIVLRAVNRTDLLSYVSNDTHMRSLALSLQGRKVLESCTM
jgi:NADPH:quinone reductase-like Zn-dependent oxidoreductase